MGLHHGSIRHSGNQSARRHITRDKPDRASVANDDDERSKEHDGRGKRLRSTGPTPTTALSRSAKHGLASLVLPWTDHQHRGIPLFSFLSLLHGRCTRRRLDANCGNCSANVRLCDLPLARNSIIDKSCHALVSTNFFLTSLAESSSSRNIHRPHVICVDARRAMCL